MANINIKLIMIFSLAAVILSILAGGIGGVAFIEILIRSLFAGVIFGALGFGVGFVIDRFLPELSETYTPVSEEKRTRGNEIDEMIDSENPYEAFQGGIENDLVSDEFEQTISTKQKESSGAPVSENINGQAADSLSSENIDIQTSESSGVQASESDNKTEDLANMEETAVAEHVSHLSQDNKADQRDSSYLGDSIKHSSDSDNPVEGENSRPQGNDVETIDSMGIDDMPSLDNFNGTFSTFNGDDAAGGEIGPSTNNKSSKMDVPEYLQDPGKSAQAIQTWLQRDKEG